MMKNLKKNRHKHDQLQLLAAILARWRHQVASSKALDLLCWAMHAVSYWRTTAAIEMANKVGAFVCCCFVCCCPGGCWGNMEQVVARLQFPVASGIALDMMHRAMRFVLHWHICKAFKMGREGGTF
jgi:hypothetical protein